MTDTSEAAEAIQLRIRRGMSGEQRLLLALDMSLVARELSMGRIRNEHPEWSATEVARHFLRSLFAPGDVPARFR